MKKYTLLVLLLLSGFFGFSTTYTTVQDGDWGDPATWGGVYVSSFFPTPVVGLNYFTLGVGDTIFIQHVVNMDYNVFVRDPDILVIEATGSLLSNTNSLYNLSVGDGAGFPYGVIIDGYLGVNYLRNSSRLQVSLSGSVYIDGTGASNGFIDNFGVIVQAGNVVAENEINNLGGGDWAISSNAGIKVNNGDFNNFDLIFFITGCIQVLNGNFNNSVGGVLNVFAFGFVNASGDIDNSANAIGDFSAFWCAGGSGINLSAGLQSCAQSCIVILSVDLLDFSGRIKPNGNELIWTTQSETDHDYFNIERSEDGEHFFTIGQLEGQGNTDRQTQYSFLDDSPLTGTAYYRLNMVDYYGASTFSETLVLDSSNESKLNYYPNPVIDQVTIQAAEPIQQIRLYSLKHTHINTLTIQNNQIDLSGYPSGLYIMEVEFANSRDYLKVVKQ